MEAHQHDQRISVWLFLADIVEKLSHPENIEISLPGDARRRSVITKILPIPFCLFQKFAEPRVFQQYRRNGAIADVPAE
jgi:hypothetical protein